ncbi:MAG: hypothetical protein WC878_05970 [Candidatus Paceibacterota bacterium]|jgi:uncharacterized protein YxeA
MKKIFLIVFAVTAIIVAGIMYSASRHDKSPIPPFVQKEQPTEQVATTTAIAIDTSNWEVYKNKTFNFAVKYPKDLKVAEDTTDRSAYFNVTDYLNIPEGVPEGNLFFVVGTLAQKIDNPKNLSIDEWMTVNEHSVVQDYYDPKMPENKKHIMVQGEPALHFELSANAGYSYTKNGLYDYIESATYFLHNGYLYTITYTMPPTNPTPEWKSHPYYKYLEQSVPITEAIVNSFKFIDAKTNNQ